MRWSLLFLAACGSDRVVVMSQVIHVEATKTDCTSDCYGALELNGVCMPNADPIDADTTAISVVTNSDADEVAGVVQLQYTDASGADNGYLTFMLGAGEVADAPAFGDAARLYRIDLQHGVVEIDHSRLTAASGNMLRFEYLGWTETHTVDKPRPMAVDVFNDTYDPCCSTARPTTGALWLLALTRILARRRCRRVQRPRR